MNNSKVIIGGILIILGITSLLDINIWPVLWPLFLIFIGLRIMGKNSWENQSTSMTRVNEEGRLDETIIFNSANKKIIDEKFDGGKILVVFGGGEIDLRETIIEKNKSAVIEVTVIFGELKIKVSEDWEISDSVETIAGNFDNKVRAIKKTNGHLKIEGRVIFGRVEIAD